MTRTVEHNTFVIERTYAASPARVFGAFADSASKVQWFGDPGSAMNESHTLDFRVGGREALQGEIPGGGPTFTYDAVYQDIVDGTRIVYTYEMTMDGRKISISVATVEVGAAAGGGTHLVLTEQGAYLDGLDTGAVREEGTHQLLDSLGRYVEAGAA